MWLICWGPQLNVAGRKLAIYILKRLMLHERLLLQKWYCVTQLKLLTYMRRTIVQWWQQQILWRYWQAWVLRGWLITIVTMALMTAITISLMTMLMTTWAPLHSPWCSVPRARSRPEKVFLICYLCAAGSSFFFNNDDITGVIKIRYFHCHLTISFPIIIFLSPPCVVHPFQT